MPGRRGSPQALAIILASLGIAIHAHRAPLSEAGARVEDRVVTYFASDGWRVFDPVRRTEELVFGLGHPKITYWDSTASHVEYLDSGLLYRLDWEVGAQPWPRFPMPMGVSDWWFNPDSMAWQGASGGGVPRQFARTEPPYARCFSNLWQSDRDGLNWRIIRSDTLDCGGCFFCETWRIRDTLAMRRQPAIGRHQAQAAMTVDRWGGPPEPIPPPDGESDSQLGWYYIPSRDVPGCGIALRIAHRRWNPTDSTVATFMPPLYWIDRARGKQTIMDMPHLARDSEAWRIGMEEHDGYLLVSGIRTYLYDLRTGEQILPRPGALVNGAIWIKRPAPARVDSVGLRRLRARFR